jgi:ribosome-binding protein aMBF1 (putative translation factor)
MKNIKQQMNTIDAMADARNDEKYDRNFRSASLRLRLADEIFNAREARKLSQQALAKHIFSTQKVISRIENGDVNIGIDIFDRLSEELDFNTDNLLRIFNHIEYSRKIEIVSPVKQFANKRFFASLGANFTNAFSSAFISSELA